MILALYILVALAGIANLCLELKRDLMMFQQNSYRPDRYRRWLSESGDSTSVQRLCAIFIFLLLITPFCSHNAGMLIGGSFFVLNTWTLAKKKYKKPLVMTARASRIYITALFLAVIVAGIIACIYGIGVNAHIYALCEALLFSYCISHVLILAANMLLSPVEKRITNGYINDARRRLEDMPGLKIIGITGSYGKTSTKHYLYRILSEQYETLMTPGSYNTTLGVVRTIRELLKPYHEVFIVEMGAKQPDDIAEICRLVHPHKGIITAVGPQHLESFKTIECVRDTKFELADAIPSDGLVLVNNDFEMIAGREVDNTVCLRYAIRNTEGADYIARDIVYGSDGTDFTVIRTADGQALNLHTRLLGEANISDILAAVAMAMTMGVPDDRIVYAVSRIEHVEHRLSVKKFPGGLTIIDDAFNSNPVGSAMALDVLAAMPVGGRVLVTPGMVELGVEQEDLNKEFGRHAAGSADYIIVVSKTNREAILAGINEAGFDKDRLFVTDTFAQAQALITTGKIPAKVILYENDLPDTFK
ncbi:MAG: UDP-N-acetylmuramoyl-tripeptide--D-alanyl-D-alanine ligase [Muribaculaceae bacterium]|nr:UDP-N-acetylmuramoyl-tripeptide--D-alanyl-D-alanine ligase [Muribaculaceae bacterium]